MPHLRFRGFDESALDPLVPSLISPLAGILGCPEDWITLESVATRFLTRPASPMIEVIWFERGPEVRDRLALTLHEAFVTAKQPAPVVVFSPVAKADYYEDGKNFA